MARNDKEHVNLDHARQEHQIAVMKRIVKDDKCPFCKENLHQYHTKPILFENEHWILTENFAPYDGARYHYLLISLQHCLYFWELSPEAQTSLFDIFNQVRKDAEIHGGIIVMRWGDTEYTSATVTHLHAQLVTGGSKKDGGDNIITAIGYKTPIGYRPKTISLLSEFWDVVESDTSLLESKYHYLLTPKKACGGFWELSPEAQRELFSVSKTICTKENIVAGAFIMRFGDTTYSGSSVPFFQVELVASVSREKETEKILISLGYKVWREPGA